MLILEIAGGIIVAVLVLLFLAYWIFAGLTDQPGAGYCCMIALAMGAWFFSTAIGIAVTALMTTLATVIVLWEWVDWSGASGHDRTMPCDSGPAVSDGLSQNTTSAESASKRPMKFSFLKKSD